MSVLKEKRVLLTGGLGTLGRAQARLLARECDSVVVLDQMPQPKGAAITSEMGDNIHYLNADLNDIAVSEEAAQDLAERAGGCDILINNAALIINKPYEDFSLVEYEEQLRVNASAAFSLARACARTMKSRGWGRIINFTSLTLNGQWDGYVPYVASKGALLGLTKGLARELGPFGITVNAVAPGAVVSEAEERVFGDRLAEYNDWVIGHQSLKKRIKPEHIADLVLFLVSPAADMISGQNIGIDGGW